jgi:hypothetical protein
MTSFVIIVVEHGNRIQTRDRQTRWSDICNQSFTVLPSQYQVVIESVTEVDKMKGEPWSTPAGNFVAPR